MTDPQVHAHIRKIFRAEYRQLGLAVPEHLQPTPEEIRAEISRSMASVNMALALMGQHFRKVGNAITILGEKLQHQHGGK